MYGYLVKYKKIYMQKNKHKNLHINGSRDVWLSNKMLTPHCTACVGKNFIKYTSRDNKITVCSESRSNVWCVKLKNFKMMATIHKSAKFKYLAWKQFWSWWHHCSSVKYYKSKIVFTKQSNETMTLTSRKTKKNKNKKNNACIRDYESWRVKKVYTYTDCKKADGKTGLRSGAEGQKQAPR